MIVVYQSFKFSPVREHKEGISAWNIQLMKTKSLKQKHKLEKKKKKTMEKKRKKEEDFTS